MIAEPRVPVTTQWRIVRGGPDTLRTCVVGPPEPASEAPLVLATLGYRGCVDDFEIQRFQLISAVLGWQILVVDTPGYGYSQIRMDERQRKALHRGDFLPLAETMVEAAVDALPGLSRRRVSVMGYSLGASSIAAVARLLLEEGVVDSLERAVLVEPVAARRWSLGRLGMANMAENTKVDTYLGLNHRFSWAVPPTDRGVHGVLPQPSTGDLWAMIRGLSRGGLPREMVRILRAAPGLRVDVVYGGSSEFVPADGLARLTGIVERAGGKACLHPFPDEHHALWHSLEHVERIARSLAEQAREGGAR